MTVRTWLYGLLSNDQDLFDLVGDRIFAKKSLKSSVELHPYIVYKIGNDTSEDLAEDQTAHRQFFQVWVHDYSDADTADYMRIDEVVAAVKRALFLASSAEYNVLGVTFLETSQDLNDETLGTVFRYLRFQAIVGS
jgi:hypothetical protein